MSAEKGNPRIVVLLLVWGPAVCVAADLPFFETSVTVKVTLTEGKITVDTQTVKPANRIVFEVKNGTDKPHHFVVAVTGFPPDKLPVKDGRVRYYTYSDEPHKLLFRDGGGWSEQAARGTTPTWGPHRREPGVKIPPGKTVVFREVHMYDPKFSPGTAFVLFCNEPGHYDQGEYAGVMVKSPAAEDRRPLEYRTIAVNGDKGGMLTIVGGDLRLVNSPSAWTEWTLRQTDKGWTIQARLSREEAQPRFLSVDAEGKVSLAAELGDGCYWKLARTGDRISSFDAKIQASGGKYAGWYLGFSDQTEQVEKGTLKCQSYRAILGEKPGPRTNLHIFIDGP